MQRIVQVAEGIRLRGIGCSRGGLDRDVGQPGQGQEFVEMLERVGILGQHLEPAMVDHQRELRMGLGDPAELLQEHAGLQGHRHAGPLGGWPDPVIGAGLHLGRLVAIEHRPAQAHHARRVAPARDQPLVAAILGRELAHDGEAVGIFLGDLDRQGVRRWIPARRRMIQAGIDTCFGHLRQQLLGREARNLAMAAARRNDGLRPEMNLRVDDLHLEAPVLRTCSSSRSTCRARGPSPSRGPGLSARAAPR